MPRAVGSLALTALAVAALTGCSASVGSTPKVPKADVEKSAKDALTQQVGQAPDSVTCPNDLDATVGASERCTLSAGGQTIGLTVTVSSVDSGTNTAHFDVKVDSAPASGGATGSSSSDSGSVSSTGSNP
jgi:hypothetical protein